MDGFLNHEHNNGKSILMTIDSLPDKYSQEKVRAMEDLVKSLRGGRLTEAGIRPVESSLVSVLAHPPLYAKYAYQRVDQACSGTFFCPPVPDL